MSTLQTETPRDKLAALRIQRKAEPARPSAFVRFLKWVFVLVFLAGVGIGGVVLAEQNGWLNISGNLMPEALRAKPVVRVTRVIVETGRAADAVVVATGYVESLRQAKIGARAAGRIEAIHVEEGTKVPRGFEIAILDHKDIDAALAATRANLMRAQAELLEQDVEIERSKKDFERATKLRANGMTEVEFDRAKFGLDAAIAKKESLKAALALSEARVQESEQFKENMIVRAPFDGTVISKDAEVGESILPGGMGEASGRGSVVTIADLDHLEVECDVKEDYISRVTEGSPAEVAVDAVPDRRYKGIVRKVIPMGDRARATIKVKVAITDADPKLFPEMSATVYFLTEPGTVQPDEKQKRVFCDNTALVGEGETRTVWRVTEDLKVKSTTVKVGETRDTRTEILEGLSGGERVVLNPPATLQADQVVKIRD